MKGGRRTGFPHRLADDHGVEKRPLPPTRASYRTGRPHGRCEMTTFAVGPHITGLVAPKVLDETIDGGVFKI